MDNNKDKHPLISIIMPVYNAEKYLRASIDSLLRQTYKNLEIIIINDGSTDNSQDIIDYYKNLDSRIISIKQNNLGVVAASNNAARISTGLYITKADADDISFDTKIEDMVQCALQHPRAIVISGSIEVINARGEFIYREPVLTKDEDIKMQLYIKNPLPNGATMFKRSAFLEVGGYDDVFAEDLHLWTKLRTVGDFVATGTIVYQWRLNPTGLTMSNKQKTIKKEKEYLTKIWDEELPKLRSRSDVIKTNKYYIEKYGKSIFGPKYKMAFLFDLARVSTKLIKRGHVLRGIHQLIIIASTGRTGLKIVLQRTVLSFYRFNEHQSI